MNKKFCLFFFVLFSISLLYPLRFNLSSSLGFDSNYLRLSDDEIGASSELLQEYGGSDKIASLINRYKINLRYFFDRKKKSFFIDVASRYNYYTSNSEKNL